MADLNLSAQMRVGELIEVASAINKIKVRHLRLLFSGVFLYVILFDHSSLPYQYDSRYKPKVMGHKMTFLNSPLTYQRLVRL